MTVKLLYFKPNKDGSVTLYLDKGADQHTLIDLSGKDISITLAVPDTAAQAVDSLDYVGARVYSILREVYALGQAEEQAKWQPEAPHE